MNENHHKKESVFSELKSIYETIEIPSELSKMVQETIAKAHQDLSEGDKMYEGIKKEKRKKSIMKNFVGIAAAITVFIGVFGVSVNTNKAFAQSVKDVPILGTLASVFTGSTIQEQDNVAKVDALIPEVKGLKDKALQAKINRAVKKQVAAAVKDTKKTMAEAKDAWLDTGGLEEEYIPMDIKVTYEVKCLNDDTLSFVVYKTQTLASAYYEETYYNYDLNTSEELTLKNLLGDDYMKIANKQISSEITKRSKVEGSLFWDDTEGIEGFTSITKTQSFYVNKSGNPVVVFNKYEIAPGYMGIQEFEITK